MLAKLYPKGLVVLAKNACEALPEGSRRSREEWAKLSLSQKNQNLFSINAIAINWWT